MDYCSMVQNLMLPIEDSDLAQCTKGLNDMAKGSDDRKKLLELVVEGSQSRIKDSTTKIWGPATC